MARASPAAAALLLLVLLLARAQREAAAAADISGVTPLRSRHSGGVEVTISGSELSDGGDVTRVTLAGVDVAAVLSQSSAQLVVLTAPSPTQRRALSGAVCVYRAVWLLPLCNAVRVERVYVRSADDVAVDVARGDELVAVDWKEGAGTSLAADNNTAPLLVVFEFAALEAPATLRSLRLSKWKLDADDSGTPDHFDVALRYTLDGSGAAYARTFAAVSGCTNGGGGGGGGGGGDNADGAEARALCVVDSVLASGELVNERHDPSVHGERCAVSFDAVSGATAAALRVERAAAVAPGPGAGALVRYAVNEVQWLRVPDFLYYARPELLSVAPQQLAPGGSWLLPPADAGYDVDALALYELALSLHDTLGAMAPLVPAAPSGAASYVGSAVAFDAALGGLELEWASAATQSPLAQPFEAGFTLLLRASMRSAPSSGSCQLIELVDAGAALGSAGLYWSATGGGVLELRDATGTARVYGTHGAPLNTTFDAALALRRSTGELLVFGSGDIAAAPAGSSSSSSSSSSSALAYEGFALESSDGALFGTGATHARLVAGGDAQCAGLLHELRVFDHALTPSDAASLAAAASSGAAKITLRGRALSDAVPPRLHHYELASASGRAALSDAADSGEPGYALELSGSASGLGADGLSVSEGAGARLRLASDVREDYTLAVRVRFDALPAAGQRARLLALGSVATAALPSVDGVFVTELGQVQLVFGGRADNSTAGALAPGQWAALVVQRDADSTQVLAAVDGVPRVLFFDYGGAFVAGEYVQLASAGGASFAAQVALFSLWRGALPFAELPRVFDDTYWRNQSYYYYYGSAAAPADDVRSVQLAGIEARLVQRRSASGITLVPSRYALEAGNGSVLVASASRGNATLDGDAGVSVCPSAVHGVAPRFFGYNVSTLVTIVGSALGAGADVTRALVAGVPAPLVASWLDARVVVQPANTTLRRAVRALSCTSAGDGGAAFSAVDTAELRRAHDGDEATYSELLPPSALVPGFQLRIDLGEAQPLNRLRLLRAPPPSPLAVPAAADAVYNITVLFASESGSGGALIWHTARNLRVGFRAADGAGRGVPVSVALATLTDDSVSVASAAEAPHNEPGALALLFDSVTARYLALNVSRLGAGSAPPHYYRLRELEVLYDRLDNRTGRGAASSLVSARCGPAARADTVSVRYPQITSIEPSAGSQEGSEYVTIRGRELCADAADGVAASDDLAAVRIGNVRAELVTYASPSLVVALTPRIDGASSAAPLARGMQTESRTLGVARSFEVQYRYFERPQLALVEPAHGPHRGGQLVTLHGRYFTKDGDFASVSLADVPATPLSWNDSFLLVRSGASRRSYAPLALQCLLEGGDGTLSGDVCDASGSSGAALAVDGDRQTSGSVLAAGATTAALVVLDLGAVQPVNRLRIVRPPSSGEAPLAKLDLLYYNSSAGVAGGAFANVTNWLPLSGVLNGYSDGEEVANASLVTLGGVVRELADYSGAAGNELPIAFRFARVEARYLGLRVRAAAAASELRLRVAEFEVLLEGQGTGSVVLRSTRGTAQLYAAYTYHPGGYITAVEPSAVKLVGGDTVTVRGMWLTTDAADTCSLRDAAADGGASSDSSSSSRDFAETLLAEAASDVVSVTLAGVAAEVVCVRASELVLRAGAAPAAGAGQVVVNTTFHDTTVGGWFEYEAASSVTGIAPSSGPLSGGNLLTIDGTNLCANLFDVQAVVVAQLPVLSVEQCSRERLVVVLRAALQSVTGTVFVATLRYGAVNSSALYTYNARPVIDDVQPDSVPVQGGARVTITGRHLGNGSDITSVHIGATSVPLLEQSATHVVVVSPTGEPARERAVTLRSVSFGRSEAREMLWLNAPPTVAAVLPSRGSVQGGYELTLMGAFLGNATDVRAVQVCEQNVTLLAQAPTQLVVEVAPFARTGPCHVAVYTTRHGAGVAPYAFVVLAAPVLDSVTPSTGPNSGGRRVTVVGHNLHLAPDRADLLDVRLAGVDVALDADASYSELALGAALAIDGGASPSGGHAALDWNSSLTVHAWSTAGGSCHAALVRTDGGALASSTVPPGAPLAAAPCTQPQLARAGRVPLLFYTRSGTLRVAVLRLGADGVLAAASDIALRAQVAEHVACSVPEASTAFVAVAASAGSADALYYAALGVANDSVTALQASPWRVLANITTPGDTGSQLQCAYDAVEQRTMLAWRWSTSGGALNATVWAQVFNVSVLPASAPFPLSGAVLGAQSEPALAAVDGGSFVAAWTEADLDRNETGVVYRVFGPRGVARGAARQLSLDVAFAQRGARLAAIPGVGFVGIYASRGLARGVVWNMRDELIGGCAFAADVPYPTALSSAAVLVSSVTGLRSFPLYVQLPVGSSLQLLPFDARGLRTVLVVTPPAALSAPFGAAFTRSAWHGNATLAGAYRFNGRGRIDSVLPSRVPVVGGEQVTIQGVHLGDGTDIVSVTLCGAAAQILDQAPGRVVVLARGAASARSGDVVLDSTSFGVTRLGGALRFSGAPVLRSVQPSSISALGGDLITVVGSGLASAYDATNRLKVQEVYTNLSAIELSAPDAADVHTYRVGALGGANASDASAFADAARARFLLVYGSGADRAHRGQFVSHAGDYLGAAFNVTPDGAPYGALVQSDVLFIDGSPSFLFCGTFCTASDACSVMWRRFATGGEFTNAAALALTALDFVSYAATMDQRDCRMAALGDGSGFVFAWQSSLAEDGDGSAVLYRRMNDVFAFEDAAAVATPSGAGDQTRPRLASSDDYFVVAWTDSALDGGADLGVYWRVFVNNGTWASGALGARGAASSAGDEVLLDVATLPNGNVVLGVALGLPATAYRATVFAVSYTGETAPLGSAYTQALAAGAPEPFGATAARSLLLAPRRCNAFVLARMLAGELALDGYLSAANGAAGGADGDMTGWRFAVDDDGTTVLDAASVAADDGALVLLGHAGASFSIRHVPLHARVLLRGVTAPTRLDAAADVVVESTVHGVATWSRALRIVYPHTVSPTVGNAAGGYIVHLSGANLAHNASDVAGVMLEGTAAARLVVADVTFSAPAGGVWPRFTEAAPANGSACAVDVTPLSAAEALVCAVADGGTLVVARRLRFDNSELVPSMRLDVAGALSGSSISEVRCSSFEGSNRFIAAFTATAADATGANVAALLFDSVGQQQSLVSVAATTSSESAPALARIGGGRVALAYAVGGGVGIRWTVLGDDGTSYGTGTVSSSASSTSASVFSTSSGLTAEGFVVCHSNEATYVRCSFYSAPAYANTANKLLYSGSGVQALTTCAGVGAGYVVWQAGTTLSVAQYGAGATGGSALSSSSASVPASFVLSSCSLLRTQTLLLAGTSTGALAQLDAIGALAWTAGASGAPALALSDWFSLLDGSHTLLEDPLPRCAAASGRFVAACAFCDRGLLNVSLVPLRHDAYLRVVAAPLRDGELRETRVARIWLSADGRSGLSSATLVRTSFTYKVLGSVVPSFGSSAGGDVVTVSGAYLGNGSDITQVVLAGVPAAAVLNQSAHHVEVLSAPSPGGERFGVVSVHSSSHFATIGDTSENDVGFVDGQVFRYYNASPPTLLVERTDVLRTWEARSGVAYGGGGALLSLLDAPAAMYGRTLVSVSECASTFCATVWERNSSELWQPALLLSDPNGTRSDAFGFAVALHQDVLAIGAPNVSQRAGVVHLFYRPEGGPGRWGRVKVLSSPSQRAGEQFGFAVALIDEYVAVGAPGAGDAALAQPGRAYVYKNRDSLYMRPTIYTWEHVATLESPAPSAGALFGFSVDISDSLVVVGEPRAAPGALSEAGSVHVFSKNATGFDAYGLVETLADADAAPGDLLGYSVSMRDANLAAGAPGSALRAGKVLVFRRAPAADTWRYEATLRNGSAGDVFGVRVAVRATGHLSVAAPWRAVGGVRVGAVFLYYFDAPSHAVQQLALLERGGNVSLAAFGLGLAAYDDHLVARDASGKLWAHRLRCPPAYRLDNVSFTCEVCAHGATLPVIALPGAVLSSASSVLALNCSTYVALRALAASGASALDGSSAAVDVAFAETRLESARERTAFPPAAPGPQMRAAWRWTSTDSCGNTAVRALDVLVTDSEQRMMQFSTRTAFSGRLWTCTELVAYAT